MQESDAIEYVQGLPEPSAEEIRFRRWLWLMQEEAARACGIPMALLQVENPNGCFARQEAVRFERGVDRCR